MDSQHGNAWRLAIGGRSDGFGRNIVVAIDITCAVRLGVCEGSAVLCTAILNEQRLATMRRQRKIHCEFCWWKTSLQPRRCCLKACGNKATLSMLRQTVRRLSS